MNLSLRNRVTLSFVVANVVVLILSFTVFHFLNSLNKDIETITTKSNKVATLTDQIRISAVDILKYQRRLMVNKSDKKLVERLDVLAKDFSLQLEQLELNYRDPQVLKVVREMKSDVKYLKSILDKSPQFSRDGTSLKIIGELADSILNSYTEFQEIHYSQSVQREKRVKKIINETKRNMMVTLIIGFLGTIILGLVVPGKIALPFKKIKDAIRELQNCNFDVSIYYSQDDEIGEIATEMNKMIGSFKVFEELRAERISVEKKKFDALANMFRKPVLVATADGKLVYLNNKLFDLLQVQSEDVIGKEMTTQFMPQTIIDTYELAIKRRSKIENSEIIIPAKIDKDEDHEDVEEKTKGQEEGVEVVEVESVEGKEPEYIYKGYANVVPIRGKDSSLDYYLMVLSKEVYS